MYNEMFEDSSIKGERNLMRKHQFTRLETLKHPGTIIRDIQWYLSIHLSIFTFRRAMCLSDPETQLKLRENVLTYLFTNQTH